MRTLVWAPNWRPVFSNWPERKAGYAARTRVSCMAYHALRLLPLAQFADSQLKLKQLFAGVELALLDAVGEPVHRRTDQKGETVCDHHQPHQPVFGLHADQ